MAKDLETGFDQDQQQEVAQEGLPPIVISHRVEIVFNLKNTIKRFLHSLGWQNPEITEFNRVLDQLGIALEDNDEDRVIDTFKRMKIDLRKVLDNPFEKNTIDTKGALELENIKTIVGVDFYSFGIWYFARREEVVALGLATIVATEALSSNTRAKAASIS